MFLLLEQSLIKNDKSVGLVLNSLKHGMNLAMFYLMIKQLFFIRIYSIQHFKYLPKKRIMPNLTAKVKDTSIYVNN